MKKLDIVFLGMNSRISIKPLIEISKLHNVIAIFEGEPRENGYYTSEQECLQKIYKKLCFKKEQSDLKRISGGLNIPYFKVKNFNNAYIIQKIHHLNPDLICISSFPCLLDNSIINFPKYGTINMHPSLLPDYRGANPFFWAIFNQEKEGGVTIHFVDAGEDTGDIIYQKAYDIDSNFDLNDIVNKSVDIGTEIMVNAVNDIAAGKVKSYKQEIKNDLKKAVRVYKGKSIIKWTSMTTINIFNVLKNYSNSLRIIKPKNLLMKWKIKNYKLCNIDKEKYKLGEIYNTCGEYWISCKDGKIIIEADYSIDNLIDNILYG